MTFCVTAGLHAILVQGLQTFLHSFFIIIKQVKQAAQIHKRAPANTGG